MKPWYPFKVQVWDPPFNMASPRKDMDYMPLEKAAKKWDICVSFPHMKDAYWMAVDYGVVEESKRSGREDAAGRGRRLHQSQQADLADRGLRCRPARKAW